MKKQNYTNEYDEWGCLVRLELSKKQSSWQHGKFGYRMIGIENI